MFFFFENCFVGCSFGWMIISKIHFRLVPGFSVGVFFGCGLFEIETMTCTVCRNSFLNQRFCSFVARLSNKTVDGVSVVY